jgi:hypothetical protein
VSRPARVTVLADWKRYVAWTEVLRLIDKMRAIAVAGGLPTTYQRLELIAAWETARALDAPPKGGHS